MKVKRHGVRWFAIMIEQFAPVAQLDRVSVSEAEGRGFDSRRARQIYILTLQPHSFQYSQFLHSV